MTMPGSAKIGALIRERRLKLGWTQGQLAERLGLDQGTISRIERGELGMGLDLVEALEHILKIRVVASDMD